MTLAVSVSQNMGIDLNHACVSTKISFITVRNSSCEKVMFSQVSVCPQGGGVHPQAHIPLGRHPQADTPPGRPTCADTPPGQTCLPRQADTPLWADIPRADTPLGRCPPPDRQALPWADTPLGRYPPLGRHPSEMATAADGMHPTGMHSC